MFFGFRSSGTVGEDSTSFEFLSVHSLAFDKRHEASNFESIQKRAIKVGSNCEKYLQISLKNGCQKMEGLPLFSKL